MFSDHMYDEKDISATMLCMLSEGELDESDLGNLVSNISEINQHQDSEFYFIIGTFRGAVELFGCPSRIGLMPLSVYFNTFAFTTPSLIFNALICNPKELPHSIQVTGDVIIVLFGDHNMKIFYNIYAATSFIETTLSEYDQSTIDDFAVLIGKEKTFSNEEWIKAITGEKYNGPL